MSKFKNNNTVTLGENNLGSSPYGAISIASIGASGSVGHYSNGVFYPHADGSISSGEMLTFEIGRGRVIGFDCSSIGEISIMEV